jgi:hypothetical protein
MTDAAPQAGLVEKLRAVGTVRTGSYADMMLAAAAEIERLTAALAASREMAIGLAAENETAEARLADAEREREAMESRADAAESDMAAAEAERDALKGVVAAADALSKAVHLGTEDLDVQFPLTMRVIRNRKADYDAARLSPPAADAQEGR